MKSLIFSLVFGLSILPAAWGVTNTELRESAPEMRPIANETELKPHIALLAGPSIPEGSYNTGAEYGIDVGFQPYVPFGLGLELTSATYDADGASDDYTRTKLMAKGTYNLAGMLPVLRYSYLGLGVGPMYESTNDATTLYMGLMPNLGFDIPLTTAPSEYLSLGANARYLITNSGGPDVFALNGVMKYWF